MPVVKEIYIPEKEYIPTEEDIFADGWTVEQFFHDFHDDHVSLDVPFAPINGHTEEECCKQNAIIQERWKRAIGIYWGGDKHARLVIKKSV